MTNEEAITKLTNIMHDDHYAWHPSILTAFGMAVDALRGLLSAQPTHGNTSNALKSLDCIDRQDAIDAMCELMHHWFGGDPKDEIREIKRELEKLSSAQPQRWIPVTERLPEDYTDVLAWFEYFRYGDYNCLYQTHGIGNYSTKYDSWMINHETGWRKLRVIAWMPLPEPYVERREG